MSHLLGNLLLTGCLRSAIICYQEKEAVVDTPFLKDLTREQYDLLLPLFEQISAPNGTEIFKQGEEALYLYLILQGRVAILYKPHDGPKLTLTHLHEGDIFGWSSLVGSETYTSDALSTNQVEMLRIRGADLRKLYFEHPSVCHSVLEKLAESVSPRWLDAKIQIQEMLQNKVQHG
jgi:CRP-like cAMP-binding protein